MKNLAIGGLLAAALALTIAPAVSAAGSSMYFNDCDHPTRGQFSVLTSGGPDGDDCRPDFHRNPNGATTSDAEKVPGNSCHTWISLDTAPSDTTYTKDGWTGTIEAVGQAVPSPLYDVDIGAWTSADGEVYHVAATLTLDVSTTPLPPGVIEDTHAPGDGSWVLPAGGHLLVRICGNPGHSPQDLFVGEGSLLSTPAGGPLFPVPEIATLGLVSIGLVAIGWAGYATRQKP